VSILKEFREFAVKGNVIDLAVAVIIGGAFGKITTSLVQDIINPPLGLLLGKVDFSGLKIVLKPAVMVGSAVKQPAVTWNYGNFFNVSIQFLITAFAVFLLVKALNTARSRMVEPAAPGGPVTRQCPFCLSDVPFNAGKCKFCTSELPLQAA